MCGLEWFETKGPNRMAAIIIAVLSLLIVQTTSSVGWLRNRYEATAVNDDRNGQSQWTMRELGAIRWQIRVPFRTEAVRATDEGGAVGYGYETDTHGTPARIRNGRGASDLYVAVVSPEGSLITLDTRARGEPGYGGTPVQDARPSVDGLCITGDNRTLIVRIRSAGSASTRWWRYDLFTGCYLGEIALEHHDGHGESIDDIGCQAIPRTNLFVLIRSRTSYYDRKYQFSAILSVVDDCGDVKWSIARRMPETQWHQWRDSPSLHNGGLYKCDVGICCRFGDDNACVFRVNRTADPPGFEVQYIPTMVEADQQRSK